MLNMKYAIMGQEGGQTFPVMNPHANGNGWFVKEVRYVPDADHEILGLHEVNPKEVALVQDKFKDMLGGQVVQPVDSTCGVTLTKYDANALEYEVVSPRGGVVVFSDIYYPGWQAWVDGEPVDVACADYILRAIKVDAGKHAVAFKFDPKSLHVTEAVANGAMVVLLLVLLFVLGRAVWQRRKMSGQGA